MAHSVDRTGYPLVAAATAGRLGIFVDAYSQDCVSKVFLDQAGIQIVSSLLARRRILPAV
jgi:hypothetical protein